MRKHILILGLAASGKTTLAKRLKEITGFDVISFDDHRYGNNWVKKSLSEFRQSVLHAINLNDTPKIIETTYNDGTDSTHARGIIISELIPCIKKILIIKPQPLEIVVAQLIDRSINRVLKIEPQGSCEEKSLDRSRLVMKNIEYYNQNVNFLNDFAKNYECIVGTREELFDACK